MLLKWLTGWAPLMDEEGGDTGGSSGGGGDTQGGNDGQSGAVDNGGSGQAGSAGAGDKGGQGGVEVSAMSKAIADALNGGGEGDAGVARGEQGGEGKPSTGEAAAKEKERLAREAAELEGKTETEKQAILAKRQKAADAELLKKKPEDFKLTDQERAVLGPRGMQRFHELNSYAKAMHTQNQELARVNTELTKARDDIVGLLQETQTTGDDLGFLLQFNQMMKTGKFEDALKVVDSVRAEIMRSLGREGPGVDLLADFQDLSKDVKEGALDRARALEIAKGRRMEQQRSIEGNRQSEAANAARAQEQEKESALKAIDAYSDEMKKSDLDWDAKQAQILKELPDIIREYPPKLWLSTIKMMVKNIAAPSRRAAGNGGDGNLRGSGQRAGDRAASSMQEAISKGLGYNQMPQ